MSPESNTNDFGKSCRRHICPLAFILGAGAFCGLMIALDKKMGTPFTLVVHFTYFGLALLGVTFHLAKKYREVRDTEGFELAKYWLDYAFRLLQACIYVFIIDNLVSHAGPEAGDLARAATNSTVQLAEKAQETGTSTHQVLKGLTANMSLVALFTGLYIRKVEAAIENLGERFGELLKGILGASVERLTEEDQRQISEKLKAELERLKTIYLGLSITSGQDAREIEGLLRAALEQWQKGRLEATEKALMDIEFRLKGLRNRDPESGQQE